MRFDPPLIPGTFIRRYKRFFADVRLADGRVVTAHCPNTGAMSTCQKPGWPVLLRPATDPRRRLAYTWELVHNGRCWICVNTQQANRLVARALEAGIVRELSDEYPPGRTVLRREVAWPGGGGRSDFMLAGRRDCYVEVKSVTLKQGGVLLFPDAPSERGRRHLRALMDVAARGQRAVLLFLAQRSDGRVVRAARSIDPEYAELLLRAQRAGVEVLAYQTKITRHSMRVARRIEVEF